MTTCSLFIATHGSQPLLRLPASPCDICQQYLPDPQCEERRSEKCRVKAKAENISVSMSYNCGRNRKSKYETLTIAACLIHEHTPSYIIIIMSVVVSECS